MNRFMPFVICVLTGALLGVPASADDPPKKLTAEEQKELFDRGDKCFREGDRMSAAEKWPEAEKQYRAGAETFRRLSPDKDVYLAACLGNVGKVLHEQGKSAQSEDALRDALKVYRELYPEKDYPRGHKDLVEMLTLIWMLQHEQQKLPAAEATLRDLLALYRRMYPDNEHPRGHPEVAEHLFALALLVSQQGCLPEAEKLYREALDRYQKLYPVKAFPRGHKALAGAINDLAAVIQARGRVGEAEPLYRDALAMLRQLYPKGTHPDGHSQLAMGLNNYGIVLSAVGRLGEAEALLREATEMTRRLRPPAKFPNGHPELSRCLHNLGAVLVQQGRHSAAEPVLREALAMREKQYAKKLAPFGHPDLAQTTSNLASALLGQGKAADAEPLFRDALAAYRLFHRLPSPRDVRPDLIQALSNLGGALGAQGREADAEPLLREAIDLMRDVYPKSVYPDGHPHLALALTNLATVLHRQGKEAEATARDAVRMYRALYPKTQFPLGHENLAKSIGNYAGIRWDEGHTAGLDDLLREALVMYRAAAEDYARTRPEGDALTLVQSHPPVRDAYLSDALDRRTAASVAYQEVWAGKGLLARVYERRHLTARAAATSPVATALLKSLTDDRLRRAGLLMAPEPKSADERKARDTDLRTMTERIDRIEGELRPLLPPIDRHASATAADAQKALPAAAAVVDLLHVARFERGKKPVPCYLAFVLTPNAIRWVNLGPAEPIDGAVTAWRLAIAGDPPRIPPASAEKCRELGGKVRELVWDKVRKELPASVKTVYVCPDAALCRVPWGALPGDKPGTILLEDFAVATIPHAPFLLDKLWPQDPLKNPPAGALVVGGVKYDADLAPPAPNAVAPRPGDPLVKPGAKLGWSFLPGTAAEATGVFGAATAKKLPVTALKDEAATAPAVLAALPKAKYAHFATHGFFADASFRGIFQLDEKDYEQSRRGERIGRAANSPLVMTGLVFAGANNPKTPGRGIVTGESLIDLDLSGLDLAVLSACETGLGDVAGGEGTFGLERAFHYAGTRDVVASLWKVPDQSTAALMALFYRNLWDRNLPPMEALRQAQLEIYRNPGAIPALAKGFRGKFDEVPGAGEAEVKPLKDGKAHPVLWAAFTLSGPGR